MLHLDQAAKGRYIKLGNEWVKLDRISKVDKSTVGGKVELTIKYADKKGNAKQIVYKESLVDNVEKALRKEGKLP